HSPWNKSASHVFSKSYIKYYNLPSTPAVVVDVEDAFFTRLKTLKQKIKVSRLTMGIATSERARARRYQRKTQVCSRYTFHFSSLSCLVNSCFIEGWKSPRNNLNFGIMSKS